MSLSTPQVLVGEEEEGSAYVDPLITLQDPMFAMLNSGDGMPAHHRRYPPTAPSQISFDPSTPYTHSMGATSFTTPNDPPQDSGSPSPAFHAASTLQGEVDMIKDLEVIGSWPDTIPNFPSTLEPKDFKDKKLEDPSLPASQNGTVPAVIQPGTDKMSKLRQAVVHLYETCMSMDSSMTECSRVPLLQMQDQLPEINKHISSMVHQPTSTDPEVTAQDQPPPDAPDDSKPRFKCLKCGKKAKDLDKSAMRRHANDQHHPEFKYHCSECDFVNVRRDRLAEHIHMRHHRDPYHGELDQHKECLPFEPFCSICHCQVSSWKAFYSCFISHCAIGGPPPPSDASSSRRPSLGQSIEDTDDGANPDPSQPSPATDDPRPAQQHEVFHNPAQQFWPASQTNAGQHLGNPTALPNHLPGQHPVPNHHFGGMAAPPVHPASGSGASGNGRRLIPSDGGRMNPPFVQRLRHSLDPSIDPRYRIRRSAPRAHRSLSCNDCRHRFADCHVCCNRTNTTGGCHWCSIRLGNRASAHTFSRRHASGPTSAPRMTNPDIANQNPFGQPRPGFDPNAPNVPEQGFFDWGAQGYYQNQGNHFDNFDQMRTDIMGSLWTPPRRNNARLSAMLSVDDNVLTEQEVEYSPVLDLKAPQSTGVLTSILPLIDPFKKWLFTPLKSLSTMALSGLDLVTETEEPPSAATNSDPAPECQCKCRCRTRTELAPGRRMEMSLELSPVDDSGSTTANESNSYHLRTRVQIVVKLLKLRSSVATSKRNDDDKLILEQAFAPTLGETVPSNTDHNSDDSEASDTESVFSEDDLSISSSCSDLQSLSLADNPSTDDIVDAVDLIKEKGRKEDDVTVMFDFDLHSALGKLSKWSGGSSDSICSDLSISDPGHVLEYLTAYVLYVIMALARSGEHAAGRRLSQ